MLPQAESAPNAGDRVSPMTFSVVRGRLRRTAHPHQNITQKELAMNAQRGMHSAWTRIIIWVRPAALLIVVVLVALQVAGSPSPARAAVAHASEADIGRID